MDEDTRRYRHQYEELKGNEQLKNKLIEELLGRLDTLSQEHEQEKLDHARESHFNREVQLRELKLQDELRMLKARTERDAFVLVLIDGDGMIFDDRLIQKAEAGGKEAASILWGAVRDYVHKKIPDLSSDYKIVTRIYANLKGLGDVCNRAGILDNPNHMEEFTRGFTGSKQLFDFIDVGSGKDRADDKICELFKLHVYDCHCRHIIFGCSHDNGYARLLEDIADQALLGQITLLEGVPFERELATLKSKYDTTKFEGLFRTSKINIYQQHQYQLSSQQIRPSLTSQPQSTPFILPNGLANGSQPSVQSIGSAGHGHQTLHMSHQPSYQSGMVRSPSASTNNSTNHAMVPSWATKAVSAPPAQVVSPSPTPQPLASNTNLIPRNRFGQRIDQVLQYDKNEVKRVQKLHMCNVHYLRHDCPYGDECTHDHYYQPNKNEISTLKCVARQTPCRFGSACDDVKCIYGHRCPSSVEGSKECRFGDTCRFDASMHGINLKIVRTTKIS